MENDDARAAVVKAYVLGGESAENALLATGSNAQPVEANQHLFVNAGAIEPPYNLDALAHWFEHSNSLRQNIDSYATNIDGFGHRFEPIIDFDAADVDQRIAQAMYEQRVAALRDPAAATNAQLTPTAVEVQAYKKELVEEMRLEKTRLDRFFDNCCDDMSFVTLRRRLRQDFEQLGNAYFEVLRNGAGEVTEFVYLPAFTMRLTKLDKAQATVRVKRRVTDLSFEMVEKQKRFRRYVQVVEGQVVFFKEFGDPRITGRRAGQVYGSLEEMAKSDSLDAPATELVHLKVHSARTAYGIPRWLGNLLSVIGSRQAEEVNSMYFDNKGVPPMAILVSGGRLLPESVKKLETLVDTELKGRKNFHKILILEAESTNGTLDSSGSMKLEMKSLMDSQHSDALFQAYDERNIDKVGMAFRLPRLLRGDIRDFNRASAEAALEFAEQQVFQPEREEFDFVINRRILNEMSVRFWRMVSNGPTVNDPAQLAEIIVKLVTANVLTPEEAREMSEAVLGKELKNLQAAWVKQPVALTLAGMLAGVEGATPYTGDEGNLADSHAAYDDLDGDGQPDREPPQVTRTALGAVITVNEARQAHGLGPKLLSDGTADPDGGLTIAEYQDKLRAKQEAAVAALAPALPALPQKGITVAELLRGDVSALPARQKRASKGAGLASQARSLLALRAALMAAEAQSARAEFVKAKGEAMRDDGTLTEAVVKAAVPFETLIALGIA